MTDVLADILDDIRQATARDVRRRERRRRLARRLAATTAAAVVASTGVAAATGNLPEFGDLLGRDTPATVTDLGDGRQRVVLDLMRQTGVPGGATATVTDLGVTERARAAPPGTEVCESDGAGLLACAGAMTGTARGPRVEIPAAVRVYRVEPAAAVEKRSLYIPAQRIQLLIESGR
jgi:hypothetical protein